MATKGGEINHYAAGITLILIGVFGIVGSVTGELANMLAALWAPDTLFTSKGAPAPGVATQIGNLLIDPGAGLRDFLNSLP